ncbi:MAG: DUF4190 domain-containing protein [Pyrinomonadaceae bacterium]
MKQCPRCRKVYDDDQLNFCLDDGELLTTSYEPAPGRYVDDTPPTIMMTEARVTNPANWPQNSPQSSPPTQWQPAGMQNQPFSGSSFVRSRDQTLPTIALILGILSIPLLCCYGGIWLGLPAAVLGFLGMRNADKDRNRYGGRGMAIGGMVLGVISFLGSILFGLIAIIAS